jgi:hypothetical protein
MLNKILLHFIANMLYRTSSNSVLEDNKSVVVKTYETFLDIPMAELS